MDNRSKLYTIPTDILFIVNETAKLTSGSTSRYLSIVPISFDEYNRLMSKPYKCPLKNQGWRLLQYSNSGIAELIVVGGELSEYKIRYIKRPRPIILTNLDETYSNVSIDGETSISECELDPILHPEILQRAVELAKSAYTGDLKSSVELGQRTE